MKRFQSPFDKKKKSKKKGIKFFAMMDSMNEKELKGWMMILIILIVADIFGIWWYLKMKTVGTVIMVVLLIFLGIIAYYRSQKEPEQPEKEEKDDKKSPFDFSDILENMNTRDALGFTEPYDLRKSLTATI